MWFTFLKKAEPTDALFFYIYWTQNKTIERTAATTQSSPLLQGMPVSIAPGNKLSEHDGLQVW